MLNVLAITNFRTNSMVRVTGWLIMHHQKEQSPTGTGVPFVKKNMKSNRLYGRHSSDLSTVLAHNVMRLCAAALDKL